MPYFQSLTTQPFPTEPEPVTFPVTEPVPTPPGPGQTSGLPLPKPSDLDPTKTYDFSQYKVGGVWVKDPTTNHVLNSQGDKATLYVLNVGDRAIQIGSHIHLGDVNENLLFFDEDGATELDDFLKNAQDRDARVAEANRLKLDRSKTSGQAPWGYRLDIAPGDSERFSPEFAPSDPIQVVKIGGRRRVPGLSKGKTDVALD